MIGSKIPGLIGGHELRDLRVRFGPGEDWIDPFR